MHEIAHTFNAIVIYPNTSAPYIIDHKDAGYQLEKWLFGGGVRGPVAE
jgi:hypothetical protein